MNRVLSAAVAMLVLAMPAQAADSLAKVRADMATAAANQGQVDKAQTAAIADLQLRVKALEGAATVPPVVQPPIVVPPPVVAPPIVVVPPSSNDPNEARAIALGRGDQYALIRTAGATSAPKRGAADCLPAGARISGRLILLSQASTFTSCDLRGFQVYWDQPFAVVLNDVVLGTDPADPSFGPLAYAGPKGNPAASLVATNITVDQWATVVRQGRQMMMNLPNLVQITGMRTTRTACGFSNIVPGQDVTIRNWYAEGPGQNAYTGAGANDDGTWDHCEIINQSGGKVLVVNFFFDATHNTGKAGGTNLTGWGLMQWRDDPGSFPAASTLYDQGLYLLTPAFKTWYAFQAVTGSRFPGTIRFTNTAVQLPARPDGQPGYGGFISNDNDPSISGTANLNFDTGQPLPNRVNAG